MGEYIAWIIGWDLVLEDAGGAATGASTWSGYLNAFSKVYEIFFTKYWSEICTIGVNLLLVIYL
jgi:hypothetical protein